MYIIREDFPIEKVLKPTGFWFLMLRIKEALMRSESPEQIHNFCTQLSITLFKHLDAEKGKYANEVNAQLFVEEARKMTNAFFREHRKNDTYHEFISTALSVNWIPPSEIENISAIWLHEIDPEKYYSLEHLTVKFSLTPKDSKALLSAMVPVQKDFIQNNMLELHNRLNYYLLKDIIVKHQPWTAEFYYDPLAMIKESSFAETHVYDGLHTRKLVGVTTSFEKKSTQEMLS